MKLKFYTNRSYLPEDQEYIVLLYPFWGNIDGLKGGIDGSRYDDYTRLGGEFFSLVPLDDADAALFPCNWSSGSLEAEKLASEAKKKNKPVVFFFLSDSDEEISFDNGIVFRTTFYRSTRKYNEFALPGWSEDFKKYFPDGSLPIRNKSTVPVVGYCGYIDYRNLYELQKLYWRKTFLWGQERKLWWKLNYGRQLRGAAVRALSESSRVKTNFMLRNCFLGIGQSTQSQRHEYVKNIIDSDYSLVVRGAGNYSFRLYELLSCGRIPVFVDTDCVLPFDHLIDWKRYCVWIDESEIGSIGDKVAKFHENISAKDFVDLQHEIRKLYEEWVSPMGFYKNLWRCIIGYGRNDK